jgi:hypothetical protein
VTFAHGRPQSEGEGEGEGEGNSKQTLNTGARVLGDVRGVLENTAKTKLQNKTLNKL